MKKCLILIVSLFVLGSCADKQKEFASIQKGMNKEQVIQLAGEPTSKKDILVAEVWKYDLADRTVVFRNGNVYDIITSAEARIDSIEMTLKETGNELKETGRDIKESLEKTGDTIENRSERLKNNINGDSVKNN